jgi:hypothetical protein
MIHGKNDIKTIPLQNKILYFCGIFAFNVEDVPVFVPFLFSLLTPTTTELTWVSMNMIKKKENFVGEFSIQKMLNNNINMLAKRLKMQK